MNEDGLDNNGVSIQAPRQRSYSGTKQLPVLPLFFLALVSHQVISGFSSFLPIGILSFCLGLIWVIYLPGKALLNLILPDMQNRIWLVFVVGLLIQCFSIQISFLIQLYAAFSVPPIIFMISVNSVLVLFYSLKSTDIPHFNMDDISTVIRNNSWLVLALIVGFSARIALAAIGGDAIAPDACLYSDYARNVLNGQFYTNVLNDSRISPLWNGVEYCFHQSFTYVSAVSFILVPPSYSGAVPLILIEGIVIAGLGYDISRYLFGAKAGEITGVLILGLPIFIFHSAFAYGPEITSLVFIFGSFLILITKQKESLKTYVLAGLMFGMADLVWYPNFLLFNTAIPIFLFFVMRFSISDTVVTTILAGLVMVTRVFFQTIDVYLIGLALLLVSLGIIFFKYKHAEVRGMSVFFLSIVMIEAIWRSSVQVMWGTRLLTASRILQSLQLSNPDLGIFLSEITPELISKFLFFLISHLTPIIFISAIAAILLRDVRKSTLGFIFMIGIGSIGTLFLFAAFQSFKEDTLVIDYFFSDSRFFLSLGLLMIIPASAAFQKLLSTRASMKEHTTSWKSFGSPKVRKTVVLATIMLFIIPSFLLIPPGIALIDSEERFGWVGLPGCMLEISSPDDVVLTSRATEMAWFTGLASIYPSFTKGASLSASLRILNNLYTTHSADYFVMDGYTAARYRTLDEILRIPLDEQEAIPLNVYDITLETNSSSIPSAILALQTEMNSNGDYTRVFRRGLVDYSFQQEVSLLDSGWAASQNGYITNSSGRVELIIGENANYTNTWRPGNYDFDFKTNSGFLQIHILETSAKLARIEFYANDGNYMGLGSIIRRGQYFFPIGSAVLGDIRIVIEGNANDSIIISSMRIWDAI